MTAASKKVLGQEPDDVEMLLPWHAAGTLSARDARRVEDALGRGEGPGRAHGDGMTK